MESSSPPPTMVNDINQSDSKSIEMVSTPPIGTQSSAEDPVIDKEFKISYSQMQSCIFNSTTNINKHNFRMAVVYPHWDKTIMGWSTTRTIDTSSETSTLMSQQPTSFQPIITTPFENERFQLALVDLFNWFSIMKTRLDQMLHHPLRSAKSSTVQQQRLVENQTFTVTSFTTPVFIGMSTAHEGLPIYYPLYDKKFDKVLANLTYHDFLKLEVVAILPPALFHDVALSIRNTWMHLLRPSFQQQTFSTDLDTRQMMNCNLSLDQLQHDYPSDILYYAIQQDQNQAALNDTSMADLSGNDSVKGPTTKDKTTLPKSPKITYPTNPKPSVADALAVGMIQNSSSPIELFSINKEHSVANMTSIIDMIPSSSSQPQSFSSTLSSMMGSNSSLQSHKDGVNDVNDIIVDLITLVNPSHQQFNSVLFRSWYNLFGQFSKEEATVMKYPSFDFYLKNVGLNQIYQRYEGLSFSSTFSPTPIPTDTIIPHFNFLSFPEKTTRFVSILNLLRSIAHLDGWVTTQLSYDMVNATYNSLKEQIPSYQSLPQVDSFLATKPSSSSKPDHASNNNGQNVKNGQNGQNDKNDKKKNKIDQKGVSDNQYHLNGYRATPVFKDVSFTSNPLPYGIDINNPNIFNSHHPTPKEWYQYHFKQNGYQSLSSLPFPKFPVELFLSIVLDLAIYSQTDNLAFYHQEVELITPLFSYHFPPSTFKSLWEKKDNNVGVSNSTISSATFNIDNNPMVNNNHNSVCYYDFSSSSPSSSSLFQSTIELNKQQQNLFHSQRQGYPISFNSKTQSIDITTPQYQHYTNSLKSVSQFYATSTSSSLSSSFSITSSIFHLILSAPFHLHNIIFYLLTKGELYLPTSLAALFPYIHGSYFYSSIHSSSISSSFTENDTDINNPNHNSLFSHNIELQWFVQLFTHPLVVELIKSTSTLQYLTPICLHFESNPPSSTYTPVINSVNHPEHVNKDDYTRVYEKLILLYPGQAFLHSSKLSSTQYKVLARCLNQLNEALPYHGLEEKYGNTVRKSQLADIDNQAKCQELLKSLLLNPNYLYDHHPKLFQPIIVSPSNKHYVDFTPFDEGLCDAIVTSFDRDINIMYAKRISSVVEYDSLISQFEKKNINNMNDDDENNNNSNTIPAFDYTNIIPGQGKGGFFSFATLQQVEKFIKDNSEDSTTTRKSNKKRPTIPSSRPPMLTNKQWTIHPADNSWYDPRADYHPFVQLTLHLNNPPRRANGFSPRFIDHWYQTLLNPRGFNLFFDTTPYYIILPELLSRLKNIPEKTKLRRSGIDYVEYDSSLDDESIGINEFNPNIFPSKPKFNCPSDENIHEYYIENFYNAKFEFESSSNLDHNPVQYNPLVSHKVKYQTKMRNDPFKHNFGRFDTLSTMNSFINGQNPFLCSSQEEDSDEKNDTTTTSQGDTASTSLSHGKIKSPSVLESWILSLTLDDWVHLAMQNERKRLLFREYITMMNPAAQYLKRRQRVNAGEFNQMFELDCIRSFGPQYWHYSLKPADRHAEVETRKNEYISYGYESDQYRFIRRLYQFMHFQFENFPWLAFETHHDVTSANNKKRSFGITPSSLSKQSPTPPQTNNTGKNNKAHIKSSNVYEVAFNRTKPFLPFIEGYLKQMTLIDVSMFPGINYLRIVFYRMEEIRKVSSKSTKLALSLDPNDKTSSETKQLNPNEIVLPFFDLFTAVSFDEIDANARPDFDRTTIPTSSLNPTSGVGIDSVATSPLVASGKVNFNHAELIGLGDHDEPRAQAFNKNNPFDPNLVKPNNNIINNNITSSVNINSNDNFITTNPLLTGCIANQCLVPGITPYEYDMYVSREYSFALSKQRYTDHSMRVLEKYGVKFSQNSVVDPKQNGKSTHDFKCTCNDMVDGNQGDVTCLLHQIPSSHSQSQDHHSVQLRENFNIKHTLLDTQHDSVTGIQLNTSQTTQSTSQTKGNNTLPPSDFQLIPPKYHHKMRRLHQMAVSDAKLMELALNNHCNQEPWTIFGVVNLDHVPALGSTLDPMEENGSAIDETVGVTDSNNNKNSNTNNPMNNNNFNPYSLSKSGLVDITNKTQTITNHSFYHKMSQERFRIAHLVDQLEISPLDYNLKFRRAFLANKYEITQKYLNIQTPKPWFKIEIEMNHLRVHARNLDIDRKQQLMNLSKVGYGETQGKIVEGDGITTTQALLGNTIISTDLAQYRIYGPKYVDKMFELKGALYLYEKRNEVYISQQMASALKNRVAFFNEAKRYALDFLAQDNSFPMSGLSDTQMVDSDCCSSTTTTTTITTTTKATKSKPQPKKTFRSSLKAPSTRRTQNNNKNTNNDSDGDTLQHLNDKDDFAMQPIRASTTTFSSDGLTHQQSNDNNNNNNNSFNQTNHTNYSNNINNTPRKSRLYDNDNLFSMFPPQEFLNSPVSSTTLIQSSSCSSTFGKNYKYDFNSLPQHHLMYLPFNDLVPNSIGAKFGDPLRNDSIVNKGVYYDNWGNRYGPPVETSSLGNTLLYSTGIQPQESSGSISSSGQNDDNPIISSDYYNPILPVTVGRKIDPHTYSNLLKSSSLHPFISDIPQRNTYQKHRLPISMPGPMPYYTDAAVDVAHKYHASYNKYTDQFFWHEPNPFFLKPPPPMEGKNPKKHRYYRGVSTRANNSTGSLMSLARNSLLDFQNTNTLHPVGNTNFQFSTNNHLYPPVPYYTQLTPQRSYIFIFKVRDEWEKPFQTLRRTDILPCEISQFYDNEPDLWYEKEEIVASYKLPTTEELMNLHQLAPSTSSYDPNPFYVPLDHSHLLSTTKEEHLTQHQQFYYNLFKHYGAIFLYRDPTHIEDPDENNLNHEWGGGRVNVRPTQHEIRFDDNGNAFSINPHDKRFDFVRHYQNQSTTMNDDDDKTNTTSFSSPKSSSRLHNQSLDNIDTSSSNRSNTKSKNDRKIVQLGDVGVNKTLLTPHAVLTTPQPIFSIQTHQITPTILSHSSRKLPPPVLQQDHVITTQPSTPKRHSNQYTTQSNKPSGFFTPTTSSKKGDNKGKIGEKFSTPTVTSSNTTHSSHRNNTSSSSSLKAISEESQYNTMNDDSDDCEHPISAFDSDDEDEDNAIIDPSQRQQHQQEQTQSPSSSSTLFQQQVSTDGQLRPEKTLNLSRIESTNSQHSSTSQESSLIYPPSIDKEEQIIRCHNMGIKKALAEQQDPYHTGYWETKQTVMFIQHPKNHKLKRKPRRSTFSPTTSQSSQSSSSLSLQSSQLSTGSVVFGMDKEEEVWIPGSPLEDAFSARVMKYASRYRAEENAILAQQREEFFIQKRQREYEHFHQARQELNDNLDDAYQQFKDDQSSIASLKSNSTNSSIQSNNRFQYGTPLSTVMRILDKQIAEFQANEAAKLTIEEEENKKKMMRREGQYNECYNETQEFLLIAMEKDRIEAEQIRIEQERIYQEEQRWLQQYHSKLSHQILIANSPHVYPLDIDVFAGISSPDYNFQSTYPLLGLPSRTALSWESCISGAIRDVKEILNAPSLQVELSDLSLPLPAHLQSNNTFGDNKKSTLKKSTTNSYTATLISGKDICNPRNKRFDPFAVVHQPLSKLMSSSKSYYTGNHSNNPVINNPHFNDPIRYPLPPIHPSILQNNRHYLSQLDWDTTPILDYAQQSLHLNSRKLPMVSAEAAAITEFRFPAQIFVPETGDFFLPKSRIELLQAFHQSIEARGGPLDLTDPNLFLNDSGFHDFLLSRGILHQNHRDRGLLEVYRKAVEKMCELFYSRKAQHDEQYDRQLAQQDSQVKQSQPLKQQGPTSATTTSGKPSIITPTSTSTTSTTTATTTTTNAKTVKTAAQTKAENIRAKAQATKAAKEKAAQQAKAPQSTQPPTPEPIPQVIKLPTPNPLHLPKPTPSILDFQSLRLDLNPNILSKDQRGAFLQKEKETQYALQRLNAKERAAVVEFERFLTGLLIPPGLQDSQNANKNGVGLNENNNVNNINDGFAAAATNNSINNNNSNINNNKSNSNNSNNNNNNTNPQTFSFSSVPLPSQLKFKVNHRFSASYWIQLGDIKHAMRWMGMLNQTQHIARPSSTFASLLPFIYNNSNLNCLHIYNALNPKPPTNYQLTPPKQKIPVLHVGCDIYNPAAREWVLPDQSAATLLKELGLLTRILTGLENVTIQWKVVMDICQDELDDFAMKVQHFQRQFDVTHCLEVLTQEKEQHEWEVELCYWNSARERELESFREDFAFTFRNHVTFGDNRYDTKDGLNCLEQIQVNKELEINLKFDGIIKFYEDIMKKTRDERLNSWLPQMIKRWEDYRCEREILLRRLYELLLKAPYSIIMYKDALGTLMSVNRIAASLNISHYFTELHNPVDFLDRFIQGEPHFRLPLQYYLNAPPSPDDCHDTPIFTLGTDGQGMGPDGSCKSDIFSHFQDAYSSYISFQNHHKSLSSQLLPQHPPTYSTYDPYFLRKVQRWENDGYLPPDAQPKRFELPAKYKAKFSDEALFIPSDPRHGPFRLHVDPHIKFNRRVLLMRIVDIYSDIHSCKKLSEIPRDEYNIPLLSGSLDQKQVQWDFESFEVLATVDVSYLLQLPHWSTKPVMDPNWIHDTIKARRSHSKPYITQSDLYCCLNVGADRTANPATRDPYFITALPPFPDYGKDSLYKSHRQQMAAKLTLDHNALLYKDYKDTFDKGDLTPQPLTITSLQSQCSSLFNSTVSFFHEVGLPHTIRRLAHCMHGKWLKQKDDDDGLIVSQQSNNNDNNNTTSTTTTTSNTSMSTFDPTQSPHQHQNPVQQRLLQLGYNPPPFIQSTYSMLYDLPLLPQPPTAHPDFARAFFAHHPNPYGLIPGYTTDMLAEAQDFGQDFDNYSLHCEPENHYSSQVNQGNNQNNQYTNTGNDYTNSGNQYGNQTNQMNLNNSHLHSFAPSLMASPDIPLPTAKHPPHPHIQSTIQSRFQKTHLLGSIKPMPKSHFWSRARFIPQPRNYRPSSSLSPSPLQPTRHNPIITLGPVGHERIVLNSEKPLHRLDPGLDFWSYLHDVDAGCINTLAPNYPAYSFVLYCLMFPSNDVSTSFDPSMKCKLKGKMKNVKQQRQINNHNTTTSSNHSQSNNSNNRNATASTTTATTTDQFPIFPTNEDPAEIRSLERQHQQHNITTQQTGRFHTFKIKPLNPDNINGPIDTDDLTGYTVNTMEPPSEFRKIGGVFPSKWDFCASGAIAARNASTPETTLTALKDNPNLNINYSLQKYSRPLLSWKNNIEYSTRDDVIGYLNHRLRTLSTMTARGQDDFSVLSLHRNCNDPDCNICHYQHDVIANKQKNSKDGNTNNNTATLPQIKTTTKQNTYKRSLTTHHIGFLFKTILFLRQQTLEEFFDVLIPQDTNTLSFYQQFIDQVPLNHKFHNPNPVIITQDDHEKLVLPTHVKLPLPPHEMQPMVLYARFTPTYNPLNIPHQFLDKRYYEQVIYTPPSHNDVGINGGGLVLQGKTDPLPSSLFSLPSSPSSPSSSTSTNSKHQTKNTLPSVFNTKMAIPVESPMGSSLQQEVIMRFNTMLAHWEYNLINFIHYMVGSVNSEVQEDFLGAILSVTALNQADVETDMMKCAEVEWEKKQAQQIKQPRQQAQQIQRQTQNSFRVIRDNTELDDPKFGVVCQDWTDAKEKTEAGQAIRDLKRVNGNYHCPFVGCKYSSNNNPALLAHYCSHTGERPFQCGVGDCRMRMTKFKNMEDHRRGCNGIAKRDPSSYGPICENEAEVGEKTKAGKKVQPLVKQRDGKFHCPWADDDANVHGVDCSTTSIERGKLVRHYLAHTGELPFVCDVCQSRFSQRQNRDSHKKKSHR